MTGVGQDDLRGAAEPPAQLMGKVGEQATVFGSKHDRTAPYGFDVLRTQLLTQECAWVVLPRPFVAVGGDRLLRDVPQYVLQHRASLVWQRPEAGDGGGTVRIAPRRSAGAALPELLLLRVEGADRGIDDDQSAHPLAVDRAGAQPDHSAHAVTDDHRTAAGACIFGGGEQLVDPPLEGVTVLAAPTVTVPAEIHGYDTSRRAEQRRDVIPPSRMSRTAMDQDDPAAADPSPRAVGDRRPGNRDLPMLRALGKRSEEPFRHRRRRFRVRHVLQRTTAASVRGSSVVWRNCSGKDVRG